MNDLLKRAAPGLALAGVALTTVWLFDPALNGDDAASSVAGGSALQSDPGTDDPGTDDPGTDDPGTDDPGTDDPGTDSSAGTSGEAAASCTDTRSATGDAVMTRWGPVQVTMELASDGTVCDVRAIAYPQDDPHSARLNASAIRILDAAAAEQGVSFDAVSGATYTSEAYRASMQSILDAR